MVYTEDTAGEVTRHRSGAAKETYYDLCIGRTDPGRLSTGGRDIRKQTEKIEEDDAVEEENRTLESSMFGKLEEVHRRSWKTGDVSLEESFEHLQQRV